MIPASLVIPIYVESLIGWSRVRLPVDEANRFGIRQSVLASFRQANPGVQVAKDAYNLTEAAARLIYTWYLLDANPALDLRRLKRFKIGLQASHLTAMFGHNAAVRTLQRAAAGLSPQPLTINGRLDKPTCDLLETTNQTYLTNRIFTHWVLLIDGYCSSLEREAFRLDWIRRAITVSYEDLEVS